MIERWLVRRAEKRDARLDEQDWDDATRMDHNVLVSYASQAWETFFAYKLPNTYTHKDGMAYPNYGGSTQMHTELEYVINAALAADPHAEEVSEGGCPYCKVSKSDIDELWHPCPYAPWKSDPQQIYQIYFGGEHD